MNDTPLTFVNIFGDPVDTKSAPKPKKKAQAPVSDAGWHKGWRVVGIPPGALESARTEHKRAQLQDPNLKDWDEGFWLMNAKKSPVRSKPYGIEDSARTCAQLAEKTGWLRVEVQELKQEPTKPAGAV